MLNLTLLLFAIAAVLALIGAGLFVLLGRRPAIPVAEPALDANAVPFACDASPEDTLAAIKLFCRGYDIHRDESRQGLVLFEGTPAYRDGGFFYVVQVWRRGAASGGTVSLRSRGKDAVAEVGPARDRFLAALRAALAAAGFADTLADEIAAAPKPAAPPPRTIRDPLSPLDRRFRARATLQTVLAAVDSLPAESWRVVEKVNLGTAIRRRVEPAQVLSPNYFCVIELSPAAGRTMVSLDYCPVEGMARPTSYARILEALEAAIRERMSAVAAGKPVRADASAAAPERELSRRSAAHPVDADLRH